MAESLSLWLPFWVWLTVPSLQNWSCSPLITWGTLSRLATFYHHNVERNWDVTVHMKSLLQMVSGVFSPSHKKINRTNKMKAASYLSISITLYKNIKFGSNQLIFFHFPSPRIIDTGWIDIPTCSTKTEMYLSILWSNSMNDGLNSDLKHSQFTAGVW